MGDTSGPAFAPTSSQGDVVAHAQYTRDQIAQLRPDSDDFMEGDAPIPSDGDKLQVCNLLAIVLASPSLNNAEKLESVYELWSKLTPEFKRELDTLNRASSDRTNRIQLLRQEKSMGGRAQAKIKNSRRVDGRAGPPVDVDLRRIWVLKRCIKDLKSQLRQNKDPQSDALKKKLATCKNDLKICKAGDEACSSELIIHNREFGAEQSAHYATKQELKSEKSAHATAREELGKERADHEATRDMKKQLYESHIAEMRDHNLTRGDNKALSDKNSELQTEIVRMGNEVSTANHGRDQWKKEAKLQKKLHLQYKEEGVKKDAEILQLRGEITELKAGIWKVVIDDYGNVVKFCSRGATQILKENESLIAWKSQHEKDLELQKKKSDELLERKIESYKLQAQNACREQKKEQKQKFESYKNQAQDAYKELRKEHKQKLEDQSYESEWRVATLESEHADALKMEEKKHKHDLDDQLDKQVNEHNQDLEDQLKKQGDQHKRYVEDITANNQAEVRTLNGKITELQQDSAAKDSQVTELGTQLATAQEEIEDLEAKADASDSEFVKAMQDEMAEKDVEMGKRKRLRRRLLPSQSLMRQKMLRLSSSSKISRTNSMSRRRSTDKNSKIN
ncbi:hypothetical protein EJ08DRAFT_383797 [Tothia fuscella]|uniref:Uncharacterized protein n=1 Tax=Tothia fuscella TaxID=1048955 RepID=A0A9P4TVT5_9PEZI|nr:hypothetical protein EJ08DRAFT_383797 [Tothia fuscella]